MTNYSKVYGHDDLYRDNTTGAIINTDKRLFENTSNRQSATGIIKGLQHDIETLKCEISEIKTLLREIANK